MTRRWSPCCAFGLHSKRVTQLAAACTAAADEISQRLGHSPRTD